MKLRSTILKAILLCPLALALSSCGDEAEPGNVSLYVTESVPFLIPTDKASCEAIQISKGTGAPAEKDITGSYLQVTKVTIARLDYSKILRVSYISITPTDGTGEPLFYAGDGLFALNKDWWSNRDAVVPANKQSLATDCPIYLGGFPKGASLSGTAVLEIVGVEGEGQESKPFKTTATVDYSSF